jgi:hypothetical protein
MKGTRYPRSQYETKKIKIIKMLIVTIRIAIGRPAELVNYLLRFELSFKNIHNI